MQPTVAQQSDPNQISTESNFQQFVFFWKNPQAKFAQLAFAHETTKKTASTCKHVLLNKQTDKLVH